MARAAAYHAGMKVDWTPFRQLLDTSQTFCITSHVRPDADAIGSEVGLAALLRQLGKTTRIVNTSATPPHLQFLDPHHEVLQLGATATAEEVLACDVHVVVDTSAWLQLSDVGKVLRESNKPRVVIDHHVSSDDLRAIELKDQTREATGSLICEFARELNLRPDAAAATALFAAVATDTGWFRFAATNGDTLRTAGWLVDCGAEPHAVFRELYERGTLARIRLAGRVLSRVTLDCDGTLAYTWVGWSDFEELGALSSDTEDLVNEGLKIAGTLAAFIAIEQSNRQVKVSFRSRTEVDVARIAEQFGGGGHKQAAGATLPGPLQQAVQQALEAMRSALASRAGALPQ
jgi:phosphoesterase RecJ-like protein